MLPRVLPFVPLPPVFGTLFQPSCRQPATVFSPSSKVTWACLCLHPSLVSHRSTFIDTPTTHPLLLLVFSPVFIASSSSSGSTLHPYNSRKRTSTSSTPAKKRRNITPSSKTKTGTSASSSSSSSSTNATHQTKYSVVGADTGNKAGGKGDQSVKGIFQSLEYGPAPESQGTFNAWLDDHGRKFGHFINNEWYDAGGRSYYTTTAPATGEKLADTIQGDKADVEHAVSCARTAHTSWSQLAPHVRARHLYAVARNVAKHARLLAVCEAVDNGKTIRESRDADIPLCARWLYHYAGWAQLKGKNS